MPKEREKKEESLSVEINPHPLVVTDESLGILYFNPASRLQFPDLEELGSQHSVLQGLSTFGEQLKKQSRGMNTFVRDVEFEGKVFEEQVFGFSERKRIYLSLVDVTALKRAETELRAANRRLGDLLVAKDQFVANMSHELRTPLAAMKEGVSLLADGILGPMANPKQTDMLRLVVSNAERLHTLIEHVLEISKIRSGSMQLFRRRLDIRLLIETMIKESQTLSGRRTPFLRKDSKGPSQNPDVVHVGVDSKGVHPESWNPVVGIGESGSQVMLSIMLLREIPDLKRIPRSEVRTLLKQVSNKLFPGLRGDKILKWQIQDDTHGGFRLSLSMSRSAFMNYVGRLADEFKARSEVRRAA